MASASSSLAMHSARVRFSMRSTFISDPSMNQTTNVKASIFSRLCAGISVLPGPVVMGQHPPKPQMCGTNSPRLRVGGGLPPAGDAADGMREVEIVRRPPLRFVWGPRSPKPPRHGPDPLRGNSPSRNRPA